VTSPETRKTERQKVTWLNDITELTEINLERICEQQTTVVQPTLRAMKAREERQHNVTQR